LCFDAEIKVIILRHTCDESSRMTDWCDCNWHQSKRHPSSHARPEWWVFGKMRNCGMRKGWKGSLRNLPIFNI